MKKNIKIKREMNTILNEAVVPTLVIGDFNGHLGFLGEQSINRNGKIVLELMENNNLILINDTPLYEGIYTWSRGIQKSAIDFVLANKECYGLIQDMYIDEQNEIVDLSDHNLIQLRIKVNTTKPNVNQGKWTETQYYQTDKSSLNKFVNRLQRNIQEHSAENLNQLNLMIKGTG